MRLHSADKPRSNPIAIDTTSCIIVFETMESKRSLSAWITNGSNEMVFRIANEINFSESFKEAVLDKVVWSLKNDEIFLLFFFIIFYFLNIFIFFTAILLIFENLLAFTV
eukprot:GHVL01039644.1.p1 GENE.GHVL01039644.1~~GHVL01039644.1.p1  ORF type:complete len:110 (+),score=15.79 GHVL01039644.1:786-1115(+)